MWEIIQKEKEAAELVTLEQSNDKTRQFGLQLTPEQAKELIVCRNESLQKYRRLELGEGILDKLIFIFCDSDYINQDNYLKTLERLQDIFYEFKAESQDRLTDEELLHFMKEQFEGVCYGDLSYLEDTCLPRFTASIQKGSKSYQKTDGYGAYEEVDEEKRWGAELYHSVLKELFWG